ncbi:hypothetical protein CRM22_004715 [Opisthorchis felineus]|uniref:Uncharacterized protein n=1 Tax=Opisthorchis felineus TaxID=147828 RepID=A0A4S2LVU6_OPIFE|nr:hypothetical protein CRM22_004715 [Opisthorchis felineus]
MGLQISRISRPKARGTKRNLRGKGVHGVSGTVDKNELLLTVITELPKTSESLHQYNEILDLSRSETFLLSKQDLPVCPVSVKHALVTVILYAVSHQLTNISKPNATVSLKRSVALQEHINEDVLRLAEVLQVLGSGSSSTQYAFHSVSVANGNDLVKSVLFDTHTELIPICKSVTFDHQAAYRPDSQCFCVYKDCQVTNPPQSVIVVGGGAASSQLSDCQPAGDYAETILPASTSLGKGAPSIIYQLQLKLTESPVARLLFLELYGVDIKSLTEDQFAEWAKIANLPETASMYRDFRHDVDHYAIKYHLTSVEDRFNVRLILGDCHDLHSVSDSASYVRELFIYGESPQKIASATSYFAAILNKVKKDQILLPDGQLFCLSSDGRLLQWITPKLLETSDCFLLSLRKKATVKRSSELENTGIFSVSYQFPQQ